MNEKERRMRVIEEIKKSYLKWLDDNWQSFQKESSIKEKLGWVSGDMRRLVKVVEMNDGSKKSAVMVTIDLKITTYMHPYPKFEKENRDVKDD